MRKTSLSFSLSLFTTRRVQIDLICFKKIFHVKRFLSILSIDRWVWQLAALSVFLRFHRLYILLLQVATCCCAGALQQLGASCCRSFCSKSLCTNSRLTRAAYALLLTLGVVASCLCLTGHIEKLLLRIPYLCRKADLSRWLGFSFDPIGSTDTCMSFAGYSGAYRICFSFTIFHLIMAILLYRVRTSRDYRNGLQNGFWFFKILVLIGICVLNFLWPIATFNRGASNLFVQLFDRTAFAVLLFIGLIGGFLFIIVQMLFLIDFIYTLNESWIEKAIEGRKRYTWCKSFDVAGRSNVSHLVLIVSFLFFYLLTIGITIALFIVYAHVKLWEIARAFLFRLLFRVKSVCRIKFSSGSIWLSAWSSPLRPFCPKCKITIRKRPLRRKSDADKWLFFQLVRSSPSVIYLFLCDLPRLVKFVE